MRRILRVLSTDQELTAREIARRTGLSTTEVAAFMCRHLRSTVIAQKNEAGVMLYRMRKRY